MFKKLTFVIDNIDNNMNIITKIPTCQQYYLIFVELINKAPNSQKDKQRVQTATNFYTSIFVREIILALSDFVGSRAHLRMRHSGIKRYLASENVGQVPIFVNLTICHSESPMG